MKRTKLILALLLFLSCEFVKPKEDDILFNIRKYININKYVIGTPQDVDLNSVQIDSIVEYPMHIHLESEIEYTTEIIDMRIRLLKKSNENRKQNLRSLNYNRRYLDSIQNIYSSTSKDDIYYKIFTTFKKTVPDTIPSYIIRDGKSKLIDSIMWYSETLFLANNKFEIFTISLSLDEELEEE